MSGRVYPLPDPGSDPRFCFGLIHDVAQVLEAAGYPPVTSGGDLVELQQALFRFLYESKPLGAEFGGRLDEEQPAPPARGHGQDGATHHIHAMAGPCDEATRCGDAGPVAVFAHSVTCPRCVAMLAELWQDGAEAPSGSGSA